MPGRISSRSSKPRRSRSKCASPIPYALCVGFSRSCALIAIWKAFRFLAIFDVSDMALGSEATDARDERLRPRDVDAVARRRAQDGAADRVELVVAHAAADVGAQRGRGGVGKRAQL